MVYTNKKYLFLGILFSVVLLLSSCAQEPKAVRIGVDTNANNECVQCIEQGNEYCNEMTEFGQCGSNSEFLSACESMQQLISTKEQCPGYVATTTQTSTSTTVPVNFCAGKSDGIYCKSDTARVECYDENEISKPCATNQICGNNGECISQLQRVPTTSNSDLKCSGETPYKENGKCVASCASEFLNEVTMECLSKNKDGSMACPPGTIFDYTQRGSMGICKSNIYTTEEDNGYIRVKDSRDLIIENGAMSIDSSCPDKSFLIFGDCNLIYGGLNVGYPYLPEKPSLITTRDYSVDSLTCMMSSPKEDSMVGIIFNLVCKKY